MSFFGDMFLGSRPDMSLPGYTTSYMNELRDSMPGIGGAAKAGRRLYNQYLTNPEELANQSLNQGAVERQTATEDYGQGDNALMSQYGGEGQTALLQRMKENRIAKINQQQGIAAQGEAANKGFGGLGMWQQGIENRDRTATARYGLMGQAMSNNAYDRTRKGGIFNPMTLTGTMQSFAGGLGAGVGKGCWIAAETWNGWDDPRVTIVRRFIFGGGWNTRFGRLFAAMYLRTGKSVARLMRRNRIVRVAMGSVFEWVLKKALTSQRPSVDVSMPCPL